MLVPTISRSFWGVVFLLPLLIGVVAVGWGFNSLRLLGCEFFEGDT